MMGYLKGNSTSTNGAICEPQISRNLVWLIGENSRETLWKPEDIDSLNLIVSVDIPMRQRNTIPIPPDEYQLHS